MSDNKNAEKEDRLHAASNSLYNAIEALGEVVAHADVFERRFILKTVDLIGKAGKKVEFLRKHAR